MEAAIIANNYEEAYDQYGQETQLSIQSIRREEILRTEEEPLGLCKGLRFAIPISLLLWGVILWLFL